jgi:enamine deaminase RidA (YjgF/YER057c/UK114 family)
MARTVVPSTSPFAAQIGFSAAVRAGAVTTVAGQTAVAQDGTVVGGDDPRAQAVEALRKGVALLEAAGSGAHEVVHTRLYLTDRAHWEAVGAAHAEVLGAHAPTATMVVCELLDPRMLVEVELLAVAAG